MTIESAFGQPQPTEQPTEQPVEQQTEQPIEQQTEQPTGSWHDSVGDDYKDFASNYESMDSVFKELKGAQSLIGKKGILPLAEDATDEQKSEYYKALGRPDEVDGYDLGEIEEGDWRNKIVGDFKEVVHSANIPADMAKDLFGKYTELEEKAAHEKFEQSKIQRQDCLAKMDEMYGAQSKDMQDLAIKTATDLGLVDELRNSPLGNNPKLMGVLAEYAKLKGKGSSSLLSESNRIEQSSFEDQLTIIRNNDAYGTNTREGKLLSKQEMQLFNKRYK